MAPLHAGKTRAGGRGRDFYLLVKARATFFAGRAPLTSALLLLANCDAADTLVMFLPLSNGHSLSPPFPASAANPPSSCQLTIFGITCGQT